MSENEFDVQRDRAEEDRENVVLTGEEIELPGEDSDASAIIGESSEPIHTGEIESVAIGGLTGRVPAAAPLKPTIEDKISTGELPIVSAPAGDLPAVSSTDEAGVAFSVASTSVVGTVASVLVLVTIYLVSRAIPGLGSVPIAHYLARG